MLSIERDLTFIKKNMHKLSDLPNIGAILEKELVLVGINTPNKLIEMGSEQAFIRLDTINNTNCLNKLCALEGAVQGIRWHQLSTQRKDELKHFLKLNKQS